MKKIILFTLVTSIFCFRSYAQQQHFRDSIKKAVTDTASQFYYPKLLNKLHTTPNGLTIEDCYYLYYGQIFQKNYSPINFINIPEMSSFISAVTHGSDKKAIQLGLKILKDNPIDLTVLLHTTDCMNRESKRYPDTTSYLNKRYFLLTRAILSTGDGMSAKTPIKVIYVSDEYIIKGIKGFYDGKNYIDKGNADGSLSVWKTKQGTLYLENIF